jgi:hypothetical protein
MLNGVLMVFTTRRILTAMDVMLMVRWDAYAKKPFEVRWEDDEKPVIVGNFMDYDEAMEQATVAFKEAIKSYVSSHPELQQTLPS